ncbi:MAG: hypothetical protein CSA44_01410 [Gammaproteobacteria bacterium]|nr:MAG: hypothetical protein CSA44_01410 [Gammaproteobacteria bacterium]
MHLIFKLLISLSGVGLIFSGWPGGYGLIILGIGVLASAAPLSNYLVKRIDPDIIALEKAAAERAAEREAKKYQKRHQTLNREKIGFQYFKSTFLFAGYLSQADGMVCDKEAMLLDKQFARLQLNRVQIQAAQDYFNQGCEPDFNSKDALKEFLSLCSKTPLLCESFLQTQFHFISANGTVTAKELTVIKQLTTAIIHYLPSAANKQHFLELLDNFEQMAILQAQQKAKARIDAMRRERELRREAEEKARLEKEKRKKLTPTQRKLRLAFITLGLKPSATQSAIKRAYREKIKHNHPDYLLAQGYPEALLAEATDKSAAINRAYRLIKKHYRFR